MGKIWWIAAGLALAATSAPGQDKPAILSVDHTVTSVSTAPATKGQTVRLYLRERIKAGAKPDPDKVVLFVHGAGTPAEVAFDASPASYSWMAYLAEAGYDVFMVDMQGIGRSQRPAAMADKCNLPAAQREQHKAAPGCKPSHDGDLTDLASDWNDITAAVNYVTKLRGAAKISLAAWSQGGPRAGGWAAQNQDRVNRMVLLSPDYQRNRSPRAETETAPRPAFNTQSREEFFANWNRQVACPAQVEPQAAEAIWRDMLASDPVGASWTPPGRRAPTAASFGWTTDMVRNTKIPTLMMNGAADRQRASQRVIDMYEDFGGDKVFIELACSSHNAMWEKNRLLMFAASREWLDQGTVNGQKNVMLTMGD